jgi:hypothetical protein
MEAFQFVLLYSSANLTVDSYVATNPGINMLARNAGSAVIVVTDPVPDDNADDQWLHGGLDGGAGVREDGSGTLTRLTLVSEATALSGSYSLALDSSNSAHIDASGTAYAPSTINNAFVSVNVSCADPDGDGVTGGDDACPTIPGPPSNNGCPPPGPPAVGGTAGLIAPPASNSTGKLPIIATLTATALIACLAGGAFVRLVARRARR